eukprot:TRINITY_DN11293_c0_g1_i1.p1 TRINITY_DN11293_c0_g1~~TRINITY_DN11293_c0_g1_i1.p1  ORF type:complete len:127 (+),score=40.11 TRINITY_DN11293_c0_g1_i1:135-515(+)
MCIRDSLLEREQVVAFNGLALKPRDGELSPSIDHVLCDFLIVSGKVALDRHIERLALGRVVLIRVEHGEIVPKNSMEVPALRVPQLTIKHILSDCLLYTSDAADDLLCVDLGGRRIIQKKKRVNNM